MTRNLKTLSGVLAVSLSASAFLGTYGCGGNKPATSSALPSVSLPENPRSIDVSSASALSVSANNAADLSKAQSEDDFNNKATARDLDLGQGGGNSQSGPLDYQALGAELQQLGVNPQDQKTFYTLSVKATLDSIDWTFPINVSFSQDKSVIWITCNLGPIEKNGTPDAPHLMDLLTLNDQMGITYFVLSGDQHMLCLQQPFTNLGITPTVLGNNLKSFFTSLKGSEPLWKVFTQSSTNPPPSGGGGSGGGGNPFQ